MKVTFTEEIRNRVFSYDGIYKMQYFGSTPTRHYKSVLIYGYDRTLNSKYCVRVKECEYTRILIEIEKEGTI